MSFWKAEAGGVIDGSEENAHINSIKQIPDGTTAPGSIKKAELITYNDGTQLYQITYKLVDGEFKGYETRQNIKCFDGKAAKRDREVNMLMRLCKLCKFSPTHADAPTTDDLKPLIGKIIGVKIQEWFHEGKEGNWISEIHAVDTNFVIETGHKTEHTFVAPAVDSAMSRNQLRLEVETIDDDLPF